MNKNIRFIHLQRPFAILPLIVALFSVVILCNELLDSTGVIKTRVWFLQFSSDFSCSFYLLAILLLFLSLFVMLMPLLVHVVLLSKRYNDLSSVKKAFDQGVRLIGWSVIVRGLCSTFGLYLITTYYFGEAIYLMVVLWGVVVIRNIFLVRKTISRLLNESGILVNGVCVDVDFKWYSELLSINESYNFVVGIEPKIEVFQTAVSLPYENRCVDKVIYIGLSLFAIFPISEIKKAVSERVSSGSEIEDWLYNKQIVTSQISNGYANNPIFKVVSPMLVFSKLYQSKYIENTRRYEDDIETKTAFLSEFFSKNVLPNLQGELILGRRADNWGLKIVEELAKQDCAQFCVVENGNDSKLTGFDKKLSGYHTEWLVREGRAGDLL